MQTKNLNTQAGVQAKKPVKLKTYLWEGTNRRGERVKGESNASSSVLVKVELRRQGIVPMKIREKKRPLFSGHPKRISPKDIMVFTRQVATMVAAGIPLIQAFDLVARGLTNISMQNLVMAIKLDVETGSTLSEALGKYPRYFNEMYCHLVHAGEHAGALDVMLSRLATYKEKTETLKGKIKKALFYPSAVILIAIMVTAILMVFVVPQFETLFKGFGAELPMMTRLVIQIAQFLQAYGWLMIAAILIGVWSLMASYQRFPSLHRFIDRLLLHLPIIGTILRQAIIARYARTLATTFAAGLPLIDALNIVAGAAGNVVYQQAIHQIKEEVTTGQQLQSAMQATQLFPSMAVQLITIGEESGTLEHMLNRVAAFYEEQVDNAVDSLSSLLEPFILVFLGIVVGGLVIAMYLPIFKLGTVI